MTKPKTFLKKMKRKKKYEVREYNQKMMNRLFLGGFFTLILLASLIVVGNLVHSSKPTESTVIKKGTSVDYSLQYFLNAYIQQYFNYSKDDKDYQKDLMSYYNFQPDVKVTHDRLDSSLVSSQIQSITKKEATYRVIYKTKNGKKDSQVTVNFVIPYGVKDHKYYISALPHFEAVADLKAKNFSKKDELYLTDTTSDFSNKKMKQLDKFINLFFDNYTSSQSNLDIIADHVTAITGSQFKQVDYVYYKKAGKDKIKAYVQATINVAGSDYSENFTFTLVPKEDTYHVTKLSYTIPLNYQKKVKKANHES